MTWISGPEPEGAAADQPEPERAGGPDGGGAPSAPPPPPPPPRAREENISPARETSGPAAAWTKFRSLKGWQQALIVFGLLAVIGSVLPDQTKPASALPDVVGQRLDVAKEKLASAGVEDDDVKVLGGGTFGVLAESNWTVCEQSPAAGTKASSAQVTVARTCGGASSTPTSGSSSTGCEAMQDELDEIESLLSLYIDDIDDSTSGVFQSESKAEQARQKKDAMAGQRDSQISKMRAAGCTPKPYRWQYGGR
jgi:beta-lactam-binding protein with PASTA domain